jgi:hypothetical protein
LSDIKDSGEQEISALCEDARKAIGKVDDQAIVKKKQIVADLAKKLEEWIPTDAICMEIVDRLDGLVSDSLIRDCLPEKYKQVYRVKNAKRKIKKHNQEINLAPLPVLNKDEEEEKEIENKEVIMIDVDGRTIIQRNKDTDLSTTTDIPNTTTDKTFAKASYQSQQEQEQDQQLKKQIDLRDLKECSSCKDLNSEILKLKEALEKSSQFLSADKIAFASTNDNDVDTANDIFHFEFFVFYKDLQKHMVSLFQSKVGSGKVWFSGTIDKNTGLVISSNLGRINQQQGE